MNLFHFKMSMATTKLLRFVFYSELLASLHQCMEHKNRECTDACAALLTSATQKHLGCWRKSLQPKCSAVTPLYRPQIKQFLLASFVEHLPGVKAANCQSFVSLHSQARLGPLLLSSDVFQSPHQRWVNSWLHDVLGNSVIILIISSCHSCQRACAASNL